MRRTGPKRVASESKTAVAWPLNCSLALAQHSAALYAARTLDAFVDAAFRLLHAAVPCDCVSVFYQSAGDRMLHERDSHGREYDAAFTSRHAELTPAIRIGMANPGVKLLPTRTGLPYTDEELRKTAFYREIMEVQGWRHAVALCFWEEPPASFPVLIFSVKRPEGAADFSDDDLAALETMRGFMEPAVRRFQEQAAANALYDAMATPLRHEARGVIVLDSRLQIIRSNAAARRLCASAVASARNRGGKSASRMRRLPPALLQACRELLAERQQLLRDNPATRMARRRRQMSFPGVPSLSIVVTMICQDASGVVQPSFVIEIDEDLRHELPGSLPRSLTLPTGLTGAERHVAIALADGLSNQEIADRLGKSVHAVKFLLHSIYRKSGIGNRARLVAVMRGRAADEV